MESIKEVVKNVVAKDSKILSVSLLGSFYKGTNNDNSDIDLGIIISPGETFTALERVNLSTELSIKFKRSVDIGIISSKNLVYSREAFINGEIIYTRDENKSNLIRSTLLGMYIDFNMNRKEIINAYKTR